MRRDVARYERTDRTVNDFRVVRRHAAQQRDSRRNPAQVST